jgi:hypothetical protein
VAVIALTTSSGICASDSPFFMKYLPNIHTSRKLISKINFNNF